MMVGTKDATLPGVRQIKEAIPGAALVEFEGAGHISNLEQPAVFTGAIRDFLCGA
jgi:3-oxoadipate enol-lactonase